MTSIPEIFNSMGGGVLAAILVTLSLMSGCVHPPHREGSAARPQAQEVDAATAAREQMAKLDDRIAAEKRTRITDYLLTHTNTSAPVLAAILESKIILGMTPAEVQASWGTRTASHESDGIGGRFEMWRYGDWDYCTRLYFTDGKLTRWSK